MTDTRSRLAVETSYGEFITYLKLTQKNVEPHENPFFIHIIQYKGGLVRLTVRVADGEINEQLIPAKDLAALKESIRQVLVEPGSAKAITMLTDTVQILHFENGEVGVGVGRGKYLVEETDKALLKEFCETHM